MLKGREKVTITKGMAIGQVVEEHPETVPVFFKHGLGCVGCAIARFESIEQGARAHGVEVDSLIADLNDAVAKPAEDD